MQKLLFLLLFPFVSFSQTDEIDSLKQIVFEYPVSELSSEELKTRFLRSSLSYSYAFSNYLFSEDTPENRKNNPEKIKAIFREWAKNDSLLFFKMKEYIDIYSIPDDKRLAYCIIYYIGKGYSKEMIQIKREYFPMFYQKYQEGILPNEHIWNFLYRLCQQTLDNFQVNQNLNNYEQVEDMMVQLHLLPH